MNLRNKKKEVEKVTQAIFVIDESGSMASCANETISGINEQIQELKKEKDVKTFATLVTFSGTIKDRLVNQPVDKLDELDSSSYAPNGSTALYDAVAHALLREENHKYETKDVSRLLIIVTDGEENSSKEFSIYNGGAAKISEMIKRVQKEGWTVTYLGANQDLTQVHEKLGINLSNIASYQSDSVGTQAAFTTMTKGLTGYMSKRKMASSPDMLAQTLSCNFYNESESITNASLDSNDDNESSES